MAPKVLIHGCGAIGSIYAYLLIKAGCEVTAVCRSNYEAVKREGFHIDSALYGSHIHIQPQVVRTPTEAAAAGYIFDYVIVSCKALPEARTAETIAPAVTDGYTTIVLIQNGINIEDEYCARFPNNHLLTCVAYLPATQLQPGRISMGPVERLELGLHPPSSHGNSEAIAKAEDIAQLLRSAGGNAEYHPDIQERRWVKLIVNASWNPMCALTRSRDAALLRSTASSADESNRAENVVRAVMLEVVDIARALGYHNINNSTVDKVIAPALARVGGQGLEPSMLIDALGRRRMEVEVILGNPVRIAKALGIEVPRLEMLYVLAKALDEANRLRGEWKSLDGVNMERREKEEM